MFLHPFAQVCNDQLNIQLKGVGIRGLDSLPAEVLCIKHIAAEEGPEVNYLA